MINCKLILIFYLIILYHKIHRVCHIFNKIQFCYTYKTKYCLYVLDLIRYEFNEKIAHWVLIYYFFIYIELIGLQIIR